jgi:RNA polymerase sigma-70 factor (ECF subfamily)
MPSEALTYPINCMHTGETVAVKTADTKAFAVDPTTWVDEHGDFLFRYAVVRLRDETFAEDCVQETLLSAMQALATYRGRSAERTWLTGILKHKIIDHFRRSVREQPITDEEADLSELDNFFNADGRWENHWKRDHAPADWRVTPEEAMEQTEFFKTFYRCMGKLPERVAGVFALREMDGLDTEMICDVLDISTSNFWVMMHRARMNLRRCMELNWFKKAYKKANELDHTQNQASV